MRRFLIITLALFASTAAIAKDIFPYKADGAKRDWFLQTNIRSCTQEKYWQNLDGTEEATLDCCNCNALALADVTTDQDQLEQWRAHASNSKIPEALREKWQTAYRACAKHLSLPAVPSRDKQ